MSLVPIKILVFISYYSPIQDKIASASTSVYEFDSMIRDQHIHKCVWTPLNDKTRKCDIQEVNKCNKYIVNDQLYQRPNTSKAILKISFCLTTSLNNFDTWCLYRPRHYFIHSVALPTIPLSPCMYMSPAINMVCIVIIKKIKNYKRSMDHNKK